MPPSIQQNTLFYGDNLPILREYIPDQSVDLIYLDPPFNSSRSYNVLFKDESGKSSDAQITAFDDSWHWGESAEKTYQELATQAAPQVSSMIAALRQFIARLQLPEADRQRLLDMTPASYIGKAAELAKRI